MDLRKRLLSGDLIAGVAAAAVLLVVVVGLDASILVGIVLAIAAYIGIVLVRPRVDRTAVDTKEQITERATIAYQTSLTKAAQIRSLATRIQKDAPRETTLHIADQADRILAAMKEDGNLTAAPLFLEQLLEPTDELLENYVRLSTRGVTAANELLTRNETQDLPMIEQAARNFFEKMHRDSIVDLAALSEVLEFNLETMTPVTPRRSTK